MKKLCQGKGRRVHPSPTPPDPWVHLAALPAGAMALAAALTAEEQEVLAYLLSSGGGERSRRRRRPHSPEIGCGCFCCYKSFWARWDASPSQKTIHVIIDAFEEAVESRERAAVLLGRRRQRGRRGRGGRGTRRSDEDSAAAAEDDEKGFLAVDGGHLADDDVGSEGDGDDDEEEEGVGGGCRSSVRRLMSFIGERVWRVWS